MESKDKEFFEELLESYKLESNNCLIFLRENIVKLEKESTPELLYQMHRKVNSFKRASIIVKIDPVTFACQRVEDVFLLIKKGEIPLTKLISQKIQQILESILTYLADSDYTHGKEINPTDLLNLSKELTALKLLGKEEMFDERIEDKKRKGAVILVVESSKMQRLLLENDLKENGYSVITAVSSVKALDYLQENLVDMVITDIEVPEKDVFTFCKKIKSTEKLKKIPVMLLTSLSQPVDILHGIESGADSFIGKPYNKELLCLHINHILENKKIRELQAKPNLFYFLNETHVLSIDPVQVTDLLLSVYMDIVDKHKKLMEANEQLNLLNEQKNRFLGMAAHDLRNPLGAIQGYSQILMELPAEKLEKDSLKILERIYSASKSMQGLINKLLDVSVIESGKVRLELSLQDLSALIEENRFLVQKIADKKKIALEIICEPNSPKILVDPLRFEQIFTNLITNAIKFSSSKTKIEVSLALKESEIIFAVKDQGQGISEEEVKKIFTPFQKLSVKPTAGEKSTGIGLSIVKKLVKEHKGRIWAESEVGKGTTFFVALPVPK